MASTRLTDDQLDFVHTFGFLNFPGLLADCADRIIEEFESVWEKHGGHNHDGTRRSCLFRFIGHNEYLSALIDEPRIHDIAASILGDDFDYVMSDGNYYVGNTGWHSDGMEEGVLSIKIALYLDPLTRDTGALRVIPGSHKAGDAYADALENLKRDGKICGVEGQDIPAIALETKPGDVVCFIHKLKHASFGGSQRRRMFTINCARRYKADQIDALERYIAAHGPRVIDNMFAPEMLRTADKARMVHLEQVLAYQDPVLEAFRPAKG